MRPIEGPLTNYTCWKEAIFTHFECLAYVYGCDYNC